MSSFAINFSHSSSNKCFYSASLPSSLSCCLLSLIELCARVGKKLKKLTVPLFRQSICGFRPKIMMNDILFSLLGNSSIEHVEGKANHVLIPYTPHSFEFAVQALELYLPGAAPVTFY